MYSNLLSDTASNSVKSSKIPPFLFKSVSGMLVIPSLPPLLPTCHAVFLRNKTSKSAQCKMLFFLWIFLQNTWGTIKEAQWGVRRVYEYSFNRLPGTFAFTAVAGGRKFRWVNLCLRIYHTQMVGFWQFFHVSEASWTSLPVKLLSSGTKEGLYVENLWKNVEFLGFSHGFLCQRWLSLWQKFYRNFSYFSPSGQLFLSLGILIWPFQWGFSQKYKEKSTHCSIYLQMKITHLFDCGIFGPGVDVSAAHRSTVEQLVTAKNWPRCIANARDFCSEKPLIAW